MTFPIGSVLHALTRAMPSAIISPERKFVRCLAKRTPFLATSSVAKGYGGQAEERVGNEARLVIHRLRGRREALGLDSKRPSRASIHPKDGHATRSVPKWDDTLVPTLSRDIGCPRQINQPFADRNVSASFAKKARGDRSLTDHRRRQYKPKHQRILVLDKLELPNPATGESGGM